MKMERRKEKEDGENKNKVKHIQVEDEGEKQLCTNYQPMRKEQEKLMDKFIG